MAFWGKGHHSPRAVLQPIRRTAARFRILPRDAGTGRVGEVGCCCETGLVYLHWVFFYCPSYSVHTLAFTYYSMNVTERGSTREYAASLLTYKQLKGATGFSMESDEERGVWLHKEMWCLRGFIARERRPFRTRSAGVGVGDGNGDGDGHRGGAWDNERGQVLPVAGLSPCAEESLESQSFVENSAISGGYRSDSNGASYDPGEFSFADLRSTAIIANVATATTIVFPHPNSCGNVW